jgi:hypothetical protein
VLLNRASAIVEWNRGTTMSGQSTGHRALMTKEHILTRNMLHP